MTFEVDFVRQLLVDIIKTKPDIQVKDHDWLNNELKNRLNEKINSNNIKCLKEINGLSNCLYWGIVENITDSYERIIDNSLARILLKKLIKDYGVQEELSKWCIETWCIALGKSVNLDSIGNIFSLESRIKNVSENESTNNYSEQLFGNLVFDTLKEQPFDNKLKLELITKGKKLLISENRIKIIINTKLALIFKEKRSETRNNYNKINDNNFLNNPLISIPLNPIQTNNNSNNRLNTLLITVLSVFAFCLLFIINFNLQGLDNVSIHDTFDSIYDKNEKVDASSNEEIKQLEENTNSTTLKTEKDEKPIPLNSKNLLIVRFETQLGNIDMLIHPEWDELASIRFREMVSDGFYNDSPWYRVVPNFVIQTGISSNKKLQNIWEKKTLLDSPKRMGNKQWTVAFGKSIAPNSRNTKVIINLVDNSSTLDAAGFTAFAEVVSGKDVVSEIVTKSQADSEEDFSVDQEKMSSEGVEFIKKDPIYKDRIVWIKKAYILK